MKIIHLSDIHLVENGIIIWDTNTKEHLDRAVSKIKTLTDIDAIFISGDLSDDGSLWSYQYIDSCFQALGIQTYYCPGNHDDLYILRNVFKPDFIKADNHIILNNWNFYFVNTAVKERSRGYITDDAIEYLDTSISEYRNPTCLIMHHPPIEPGGWLNRRLLDNRNEFNLFVNSHPNVKLILFGHIHYHLQRTIDSRIYASASSIGYAFDMDLPKFQIATGKEGFNLIHINDHNIKIENILI